VVAGASVDHDIDTPELVTPQKATYPSFKDCDATGKS